MSGRNELYELDDFALTLDRLVAGCIRGVHALLPCDLVSIKRQVMHSKGGVLTILPSSAISVV